jgi:NAD(P)-dependent dehydrogenase (short-subunit alcohol dehydrogenase family)
VEALEEMVSDRGLLTLLDESMRTRLVRAAGSVSKPDRAALRKMAKAFRRKERDERRRVDEAVLESTGIRTLRRAPVFITPPELGPGLETTPSDARQEQELKNARKCYVCKAPYTLVHEFYDQMCGPCAELNWQKRNQTADLRGRVALITGARVKIGYHAAIKLLRAGAHVIVSTRFPRDAAMRYARESDYEEWRERLEIHGLDLRHTPSVEAFCRYLSSAHSRLDFIINNACQTVRRPAGFYSHLMELEDSGKEAVPLLAQPLLERWEEARKVHGEGLARDGRDVAQRAGHAFSAALSQVALLPEDRGRDVRLFPESRLDADLQQVDLRANNSWRMTLADVSSVELLEVQLVNAVAPFILNARLKPLMQRVETADKHIVNVSAMEGQFYRAHKTDKHPHTNMAKAALNMMTRTSAIDYVKDGIHMNSVDTGWITDEDPMEIAVRKVEEHGFHPPLDVVDGAARILDPIFHGFLTGDHPWGLFLKDYQPAPW